MTLKEKLRNIEIELDFMMCDINTMKMLDDFETTIVDLEYGIADEARHLFDVFDKIKENILSEHKCKSLD